MREILYLNSIIASELLNQTMIQQGEKFEEKSTRLSDAHNAINQEIIAILKRHNSEEKWESLELIKHIIEMTKK